MKHILILLASAISITSIAQQRVVLYEHFSNANCSVCATHTPTLTNFVEARPDNAVMLGYQVNVPYTDGIYDENTADIDARKTLYNISGSPYTIMDGNYYKNGTAPFLNQAATKHTDRQAVAPPYSISFANLQRIGNKVTGEVTFTSLADNTADNLKAFIAIAERRVLKSSYTVPPGNNSETEYPYVLRKFYPSASGFALQQRNLGESKMLAVDQVVPNVKDVTELRVIAFVQNTTTNEIYQAAMLTPTEGTVSSVNDIANVQFTLAPNPAHNHIYVNATEGNTHQIILTNAIGEKVLAETFTTHSSLDISKLPAGIYLASVRNNAGAALYTQRIIKQ